MSKAAMPVSKAKTAYGLLSEIRALILAEPKRYDQWDTLTRGQECREVYGDYAPACGTVGCVAGWVKVLKRPKNHSVIHTAAEVLGLSEDQTDELVHSRAAGERYAVIAGVHVPDFDGHAKRGAAHIARFQKKYAKQLKAKRV